MPEYAIQTSNLGKRYYLQTRSSRTFPRRVLYWFWPRVDEKPVWALRHVDFAVKRGEAIGVIGPNGAGKTTLLQVLAGLLAPSEGKVEIRGRISSFLGLGSAVYPELTVEENIYLLGTIFGMTRAMVRKKAAEIVEFGDFGKYRHALFNQLSAGYQMRVIVSAALHAPIDILLMDEMVTAGDAMISERFSAKMIELRKQGTTIVLASHAIPLIEAYCSRVIELDRGRLVNAAKPATAVKAYYERHGVDG